MSVYSEAWHNTPPATRDFYRNFHNRYLRFARRIPYDETRPEFGWFTSIGWAFHAYFPYSIAYRNWSIQTLHFGAFNPAIVLLLSHVVGSHPDPGPPYEITQFYSWRAQFIDIPPSAYNYPKPKFRVPRTYWTGKPRHRRNL